MPSATGYCGSGLFFLQTPIPNLASRKYKVKLLGYYEVTKL